MIMAAELRVNLDCILAVPICRQVVQDIAREVVSDLNRVGAQQAFGVHNPTLDQLVSQYVDSGGLMRCLARLGRPRASISSIY